jgi:hypothetical protein
MLTYENFVAVLLGSLERARLNIAYTQELLDTHALGRSLSITCLPDDTEDDQGPQEPPLRAVITFRWSPEFTVFSLRGERSLDDIEHLVDERLNQAQSGPSLDVEVTYTVPINSDQQRDMTALTTLAHTIHELHDTLPHACTPLQVNAELSYAAGRASRVQNVTAREIWSIDEALYDVELLADTFDELCAELHDLLEALAQRFLVRNDKEHNAENGSDPVSGDRRYYKPPTA